MKKLLGILFLGLIALTDARAGDLNCIKDGEVATKLSISHYKISNQADSKILGAQAVLTTGELTKVMTGKFDGVFKTYDLKDIDGNPVDLKVSKVISHGGRCGRCSPVDEVYYYAKLTTVQEDLDFTCSPK